MVKNPSRREPVLTDAERQFVRPTFPAHRDAVWLAQWALHSAEAKRGLKTRRAGHSTFCSHKRCPSHREALCLSKGCPSHRESLNVVNKTTHTPLS